MGKVRIEGEGMKQKRTSVGPNADASTAGMVGKARVTLLRGCYVAADARYRIRGLHSGETLNPKP